MGTKSVSAAEAVKLFSKQNITVQTAKRISVKGDDGKVRDAFQTKNAELRAEHVLAAKQTDDGTVTITTIDGQKYSVVSKDALSPAGDAPASVETAETK